jgi:hypothetical protein
MSELIERPNAGNYPEEADIYCSLFCAMAFNEMEKTDE